VHKKKNDNKTLPVLCGGILSLRSFYIIRSDTYRERSVSDNFNILKGVSYEVFILTVSVPFRHVAVPTPTFRHSWKECFVGTEAAGECLLALGLII